MASSVGSSSAWWTANDDPRDGTDSQAGSASTAGPSNPWASYNPTGASAAARPTGTSHTYAPRVRTFVGPPAGSSQWTAWDPQRVGVDPGVPQGDLGRRGKGGACPPAPGASHGKKKRTLQHLVDLNSPFVDWYVHFLKMHVWMALTANWHLIQAAALQPGRSTIYLKNLWDLLELDYHAQWSLMNLAQSGLPGATHFAHIMWTLLKEKACVEPYEDLSPWLTQQVKLIRTRFDQPPLYKSLKGKGGGFQEEHPDRAYWGWCKLTVPHCWTFCPLAVPPQILNGTGKVVIANDGEPLKPPHCWDRDIRVAPFIPNGISWTMGPRGMDLTKGPHPHQKDFRKGGPRSAGSDEDTSGDDVWDPFNNPHGGPRGSTTGKPRGGPSRAAKGGCPR